MHCDFLGSVGLQETHMDALKPFDSKLVTLTMRGCFFTKFAALAHGAAGQIKIPYQGKNFLCSHLIESLLLPGQPRKMHFKPKLFA